MTFPGEIAMPTARKRSAPFLERGLLLGLVGVRWGTWLWMAAVLGWELYDRNVNDKPEIAHPVVAVLLVATAGVLTASLAGFLNSSPSLLLQPATIAVELAVGAALLTANDWVWSGVNHSQNLASAWPLAGVLTAGLAFGRRAGVGAGLVLAVAGYLGIPLANAGSVSWSLSRISAGVLFMLAGWAAGYLAFRLWEAETQIASAKAREEVARTLHDGVLQTLAVIQRRSNDTDLTQLARDQELELRRFLRGDVDAPDTLIAGLREAARRHESRHSTRVSVVTIEELPEVSRETMAAVVGAVGEALTNASKHGSASSVTVFAEPDESGGVFCSVKDDGTGFEAEQADESIGLSRSIRGRIGEVGGTVEVVGNPGHGSEIRLWVPLG